MINQNRRSFLKSQMALGACLAAGLDVISAPANAANLQGYKALVCVNLAGGNDSANMIIPSNASAHADYARARKFLAIQRSQLLPLSPFNYSDGQLYGLHPAMVQSKRLFDRGDLAVIANVGPLVRPISKAEYLARAAPLPKHLFAHNSQTDSVLTADAQGGVGVGWAGRTMDLMYPDGAPQPSPSISVGGNSIWQAGRRVRSFEVGINGVGSQYLPIHDGPVKLRAAFNAMQQDSAKVNSLVVEEHALTLGRAQAFGNSVNTALRFSPEFNTPFPATRLGSQLQMVARLIAIRDRLDTNMNRQMFFVRIGGFDTHNSQADAGSMVHANLLGQLDAALGAFQNAMTELGVNDSVTSFTATEFGRTLIPNTSGTDHGWGGHNLVLGGAVNGGDFHGRMPQVSVNSVDAIAQGGRFIPTSSIDQYSATLARWFGLSEAELGSVFPNLGNFSTSDLGFMA